MLNTTGTRLKHVQQAWNALRHVKYTILERPKNTGGPTRIARGTHVREERIGVRFPRGPVPEDGRGDANLLERMVQMYSVFMVIM